MTSDATRRRAIGQILLLAAGFLVLVAISASSVIFVDRAREDSAWVIHTVEVENQISTVLLEIRRAESSVRGYLLTSEPQFLSEHEAAVAGILPDIDKLLKLTGDNKVQIEAARQLRPAVELRLAEFGRAVDFVRQKDIQAASPCCGEATPTRCERSATSLRRCARKRSACSRPAPF